MNVVKLHDENTLLKDLRDDSINLIHATRAIDAIKLLVDAHSILNLNLDIRRRWLSEDHPVWDTAALSDLRKINATLYLTYRIDFNPLEIIDLYYWKMKKLFHHVSKSG